MAQPHDRLVRALLDDVDRMAAILDGLAEPPLPCGPTEGRLVRLRDVLIDPDLRRSEPDFLYALDGGEEPRDLIVVEHLSRQTPNVPLRALAHKTTLYQDVERSLGPNARFPNVHVVVLYHGASRWSAPREFEELYARKEGNPGSRTNVIVHVIDLGRFDDGEIRRRLGRCAAALLVLLLNHGRGKEIRSRLREWDDLFRATVEEKGGLSLLRAMVWYLYFVSDIAPEEVHALPFAQESEETKTMIKTTAERLREEGLHEGLEKGWQGGLQEGLDKGLREGLRKGLETLLVARFGEIPRELAERIASSDADTLEAMLRRAPAVDAPADLLDGSAP
ncbi:MAG TPA: hypothetical protein ENK43_07295 [Planctomycetes bacterium]|nr:hypothetical protein [Planctomycetota bacterium]